MQGIIVIRVLCSFPIILMKPLFSLLSYRKICTLPIDSTYFYYENCFFVTGTSSGVSMALSSIFSVLLFSAMQMYKPFFAATQINTIVGGFLGSWLFILALTVRIFHQKCFSPSLKHNPNFDRLFLIWNL